MRIHRRLLVLAAMSLGLGASAGCLQSINSNLAGGFASSSAPSAVLPLTAWKFNEGGGALHIGTTFYIWPVPVSPALTQEIEDLMERWEKAGVPILGPIKGEYAPVFCMDPPSEKDIYDTLPTMRHLVPYLLEVQRTNVRLSVEKLVDQIDECRFYPLVGPCQLHHCHFKCTVWWTETTTMGWPIPWSHTDHKQEVVYLDKDHLHRCGEPGELTGPSGSLESYGAYAPGMGAPGGQAMGVPVGQTRTCLHGLVRGSCGRCGQGQ